ncbi:MAG: hypothetical protein DHS20C18_04010 [Saprospiraceae bacterium]|nr:MAG: hypothetical protein DHS20C18_04010 [Saprospiraceae bacterium]
MKDQSVFEKAIKWAKNKGFQNIKAKADEYEDPAPFTRNRDEESFIPDITGLQTGGKSFIEIATKSEDVPRTISKWKLLSTIATMKGGRLFLLAPKGHKTFAENIVKSHNLDAQVIYLR